MSETADGYRSSNPSTSAYSVSIVSIRSIRPAVRPRSDGTVSSLSTVDRVFAFTTKTGTSRPTARPRIEGGFPTAGHDQTRDGRGFEGHPPYSTRSPRATTAAAEVRRNSEKADVLPIDPR